MICRRIKIFRKSTSKKKSEQKLVNVMKPVTTPYLFTTFYAYIRRRRQRRLTATDFFSTKKCAILLLPVDFGVEDDAKE